MYDIRYDIHCDIRYDTTMGDGWSLWKTEKSGIKWLEVDRWTDRLFNKMEKNKWIDGIKV